MVDKSERSEKEQKIAQEIEKQKNFIMNFLSKASLTTTSTMPSSSIVASPAVISEQTVSKNIINNSLSSNGLSSFDANMFEKSIEHSTDDQSASMSEIIAYFKDRYSNRKSSIRSCRKPINLFVSIAPSSASGFDYVEGYAETRAVAVDSRVKTLRFFHDERPPYV